MITPLSYARDREREGMLREDALRETAAEFQLDELETARVADALCCGCDNQNCEEEA